MNGIQEVILDIFKEYSRICDKYNLRYFAIGGTCIGAIRHQGFIPWDDDLDVAMPYEDYQKFRKIAKKELKKPYELYDILDNKRCTHTFLKIHNTETAFIESTVSDFPERRTGVFMDIMPIVGLPSSDKDIKQFIQKCKKIERWNSAHRFTIKERIKINKNVKSLKTIGFRLLSSFIRVGKPFNYYSRKYEKWISKYKFGTTERVFFAWRFTLRGNYKNVFPYSIFSDYLKVPFEDTMIRVPKNYDEYLKMDFGDYMKLPPKEKQVTCHETVIIDLNRSYKEI